MGADQAHAPEKWLEFALKYLWSGGGFRHYAELLDDFTVPCVHVPVTQTSLQGLC